LGIFIHKNVFLPAMAVATTIPIMISFSGQRSVIYWIGQVAMKLLWLDPDSCFDVIQA
jgi:hypothetical protein